MPKFLCIILTAVFFSLLGFKAKDGDKKDEIKWYTFSEAVELQKKNPRMIMVDVYTNWCGPCKMMDKNTFHHPVIAKYINEHYYPVKFNAETRDTVKFNGYSFANSNPVGTSRGAHDFAVSILDGKVVYPSIVFINEEIKRVQIVTGYNPPASFEPIVKFFGTDAYKTTKWEDFTATLKREITE